MTAPPTIKPNFFKILRFLWEFFTEKAVETPSGVEDWVRKHFDAVRVQSREAYLELVYPASRAALEEGGPMDKLMAKEFADGPLPSWTVKVTEVQAREALLMEDMLVYPVRPTHLARATGKLPSKTKTEVWYMIRENEAWYAVLPVPRPELAGRLKIQAQAQAEARAGREEKIQKLYFSADPAELTKLREMLRQKRMFDALRRVQQVWRLDIGEAKKLLELVENPKG